MAYTKITKPCGHCGVWTCANCGWTRFGAALGRPGEQVCPLCHTADGTMRPTRHGQRRWMICHDALHNEQAWEEAPS